MTGRSNSGPRKSFWRPPGSDLKDRARSSMTKESLPMSRFLRPLAVGAALLGAALLPGGLARAQYRPVIEPRPAYRPRVDPPPASRPPLYDPPPASRPPSYHVPEHDLHPPGYRPP